MPSLAYSKTIYISNNNNNIADALVLPSAEAQLFYLSLCFDKIHSKESRAVTSRVIMYKKRHSCNLKADLLSCAPVKAVNNTALK